VVGFAGRTDHLGAALARELDGADPNSSSGAVDEHRLTLADIQQVERAGGGFDRNSERGGAGEVQRGRNACVVLEYGEVRSAVLRGSEHRSADNDIRDLVAHFVNHTGNLEPGTARKLAAHHALPKLPVDRIDADSLDRQTDLVGSGMRLGRVDELEHLRSTEALVLNRSHRFTVAEHVHSAERAPGAATLRNAERPARFRSTPLRAGPCAC
jgi:hypothetical protein